MLNQHITKEINYKMNIELRRNYNLFGGGINIEALIRSCLDKFSKMISPEPFFKPKKKISLKVFKV